MHIVLEDFVTIRISFKLRLIGFVSVQKSQKIKGEYLLGTAIGKKLRHFHQQLQSPR